MLVLGALGIEALSRGASQATFCDNSFQSIQVLKENLEKTKFLGQAIILNTDFQKGLQELQNKSYDYIFLDPPYKTDYAQKALQEIRKIKFTERKWKNCSRNRRRRKSPVKKLQRLIGLHHMIKENTAEQCWYF